MFVIWILVVICQFRVIAEEAEVMYWFRRKYKPSAPPPPNLCTYGNFGNLFVVEKGNAPSVINGLLLKWNGYSELIMSIVLHIEWAFTDS
jgi:hypothetical protein